MIVSGAVIGWAIARGLEPTDADLALLAADETDPADESLQWLFEKAEQYLGSLDGYYFEQDGDTATTRLVARDASDPALAS